MLVKFIKCEISALDTSMTVTQPMESVFSVQKFRTGQNSARGESSGSLLPGHNRQ
jgi:hypothetical protein